ncbi:hypothetical protein C8Q80DRAFT_1135021 [Daedaleopsis nitida]|nr:hypothetical protein C8Q80DRAFT_1135021 [Daedaleopsis nitida]
MRSSLGVRASSDDWAVGTLGWRGGRPPRLLPPLQSCHPIFFFDPSINGGRRLPSASERGPPPCSLASHVPDPEVPRSREPVLVLPLLAPGPSRGSLAPGLGSSSVRGRGHTQAATNDLDGTHGAPGPVPRADRRSVLQPPTRRTYAPASAFSAAIASRAGAPSRQGPPTLLLRLLPPRVPHTSIPGHRKYARTRGLAAWCRRAPSPAVDGVCPGKGSHPALSGYFADAKPVVKFPSRHSRCVFAIP